MCSVRSVYRLFRKFKEKKEDNKPSIYISDHCIIVIFVDMQLITKVYSCVLIKVVKSISFTRNEKGKLSSF